MRGEFLRGDGLVLPNTISVAGAQAILAAALRDDSLATSMALFSGAPSATMTQGDMTEPSATNGYARIVISQNSSGWTTLGVAGTEAYLESALLTFTAVGGNFSVPIQRVGLVPAGAANPASPVYALSGLMNAPLTIGPATPLNQRQFRYRIYL